MRRIRVDAAMDCIRLGYGAENDVAILVLDTAEWEREFPGGRLALFIRRPDGKEYNAAADMENGEWIYKIKKGDLEVAGRGSIQAQWTVGEQVARSRVIETIIQKSIGQGEPPTEPELGFLEQMAEIGAQTEQAAARAADSAGQAEGATASAQQSASDAREHAANAKTSSERAQTARSEAEAARDRAQTAQTAADQSALDAAGSAQTAQTSALAAGESAASAGASEAAASGYKQDAWQAADQARADADRLSGLGAEAHTLEPGSQATVTAEDGKIIYGIPRGDTGAPGPEGKQGPQGEPGADGVQINDAAVNTADAWSSRQIVDTLCPAFEMSGNPVVCYPVANYPLGVRASWKPMQEGEGEPSPENIRPISGRESVEVIHHGKNLISLDHCMLGGYGYVVGAANWLEYPTYLAQGVTYTLSFDVPFSVTTYVYINNPTSSKPIQIGRIKNGEKTCTFTMKEASGYQYIHMYNTFAWTEQPFTRWQLEVGSTATPYEPYVQPTTHTLALPETIYGGEVDAATGAGVKTWGHTVLDGTEGWEITANANGAYANISFKDLPEPNSKGSVNIAKREQFCTHYKIGNGYSSTDDYIAFVYSTSTSPCASLRIRHTAEQESVNTWKSYLAAQYAAGTPVTIAYKLAEPIPFQATGGAQIPALAGTNTIYSDADSVTVTGRADPIHTIQAMSARIASLETAAVTNNTGGIPS